MCNFLVFLVYDLEYSFFTGKQPTIVSELCLSLFGVVFSGLSALRSDLQSPRR
jgi:hypothetical protein